MTFYLAHYIDGQPRYFAAETFDAFLELADRGGLVGKPIRTYTITRQHYGEATATS